MSKISRNNSRFRIACGICVLLMLSLLPVLRILTAKRRLFDITFYSANNKSQQDSRLPTQTIETNDREIEQKFEIPLIFNTFNWNLYQKIDNDYFLKRKTKADLQTNEYIRNKYKPFIETYFKNINLSDYQQFKQPMFYKVPQFESKNLSYIVEYNKNINKHNIININDINNINQNNITYKILHTRNHGYGRKNPLVSQNYTMLFLPLFKNGLTKFAPLLLLLFENIKWIPRLPRINKSYAIPGNDPSNELYVHFIVSKHLKSVLKTYTIHQK